MKRMEDKRKEDVKGDNVIEVEELFREYTKISRDEGEEESIKVLKGLSFMIKEQEFVGIMGKSGCGKTTLLKTLGVIDKPTKGKLYFCGKNTRELWSDELADIRRRKIGFVFQDFYLMDSLSVSENIMLPMVLDKKDVKQCVKMSEEYAELFGIMHLMDKYPYELSGGEKQRVAISRALINDPDVILADEPTGNLDSKSGKTVIEALERINKEMKKTIIMVTHDPQVASRCKRILFLKDGVILEDLRRKESAEEFYGKILERMKDL
jgi:ABC-type lipoprotein export system ATPase subunit